MMRATGFLLGTVLVLAVFLFALSAGISPMSMKEVDNNGTVLPEKPAATTAVPVAHGVDSVAHPAPDTTGMDVENPPEAAGSGTAATAAEPVEHSVDPVVPPPSDTAGLYEGNPAEVDGSGPSATAAEPVEHSVDPVVPPAADTSILAEGNPAEVDGSGLELDPQTWNQSLAAFDTADRNDATAVSRYLVWSPFRSKWAAQGFARRLTVATDVPMEVVHEGPGNYQVVFRYRDDGERQAMVERIKTVTGLELE